MSRIRSESYTRSQPQKAQTVGDVEPGLATTYYEGDWDVLPDFERLTPKSTSTTAMVGLDAALRDQEIGLIFKGYVNISETGVYTFYTTSDDGSQLFINGDLVVDSDGLHGTQTEAGQVALAAGYHSLRVTFFQKGGGAALSVSWVGPGLEKQHLRSQFLFH